MSLVPMTKEKEQEEYKLLFTDDLDQFFEQHLDEDKDFHKNIDNSFLEIMKIDAERFWSASPYTPNDLLNLIFINDVIKEADLKYVDYIFNICDIKIPVKERRKGKKVIFQRLLKNYHRFTVRKSLNNLLTSFLKNEITECNSITEENKIEVLTELSEKVGLLPVLWIIENVLKNNELTVLLKNIEPERYILAIVQAALFYKKVDYEHTIKKPEKINQYPELELVQMKRDQKRTDKQLKKKQKVTIELQQEVYSLKQLNKRLSSENHELFKMVADESKQHEEEMISMQEYYLQVIESLTTQMEDLQKGEAAENEALDVDLKGQTIAVIGGSRERFFREIVESCNGEMLFVAEDDFNKIEGAVRKANVVFYLKEVVGHHFFREAYPLAKKYSTPFVYINTLGISTFKRELKKLIS
ncbi:DUF2325 domain-containing protein [Viridibacillus arvi]|uniref:DUF2325 domain-containing protein n=1 Tax=Viridibacillus arvi TaxID=263475 RepID=UPI0034CEA2E3